MILSHDWAGGRRRGVCDTGRGGERGRIEEGERGRGRGGGRGGGGLTRHFIMSDSASRRAISCILTSSETIGSMNVQNDWQLEKTTITKEKWLLVDSQYLS